MPLAYWVHNLSPFLIRFTDSFGIRYYGLGYVIGFAAGWGLLRQYQRKGRSPYDSNAIADLMTYLVLGVLVGGRLGYFFLYQPDALFHDPLILVRVWDGGMASHGGFIGVTLAIWLWARKQKTSFFQISDLIVTVTPPGLLVVRLANFINGELWGKPTGTNWGVVFANTGGGNLPRHPSQLYEAALEGGFLLAFMQWRFWRSNIARTQPGRLSGEFLIAYAVVRMICEIFREPDASLLFGLSRGTFYSVFLIVAGAALIIRGQRQPATS